MIEPENDHADHGAENEIDTCEKEQGGVFLHRHHIEEAVDEFRSMDAVNGAQVDSGDAVREVGSHADKEPALDDFDDVILQTSEGGGDGEADEEDGGENEKGLKERSALSAKGDVTDQGVDGEGECQVEQAGDQTE